MAIKTIQFMIKGMQRDLSVSKFSSEYAYEMMNIRLTPKEGDTLLSLTNEKGTLAMSLVDESNNAVTMSGNYIGQCVLNDYLVIFTTNNAGTDYIYRLTKLNDSSMTMITLFTGNLGFNTNNPISCIGIYENESIQKVYWIDGLNQPRLINIVATSTIRSGWTTNSFDFVQKLNLDETVSVTKNTSGNGLFTPGTIQYSLSYYTKYGQESNIFYTSPLQYISYTDRGAAADEKVNNSFTISVIHPDTNFDYLRIYSIHRTSIDAAPTVNVVSDIKIQEESTTSVSSYNVSNPASSTIMVCREDGTWVNIKTLTPSVNTNTHITYTITSTNYSYVRINGADIIKLQAGEALSIDYSITIINLTRVGNGNTVTKSYTVVNSIVITTTATNLLLYNDTLTYIDNGTYENTIAATDLLYIGGEKIVPQTFTHKDNTLFFGNIQLSRHTIDSNVINHLKNGNITFSNRVLSNYDQGSTGYYPYMNSLQLGESIKSLKYLETYRFGVQFQHYTGKWSEAIWINDAQVTTPPVCGETLDLVQGNYDLSNNNGDITALINTGYIKARPVIVFPGVTDRSIIAQGLVCPTVFNIGNRCNNSPFVQSSWFSRPNLQYDVVYDQGNLNPYDTLGTSGGQVVINESKYLGAINSAPNVDKVNMGVYAEFRHNKPIPNNYAINSEIQCLADGPDYPYSALVNDSRKAYISNNQEFFFVDQSILTFHSPEIEFDSSVQALDMTNLKFRITGYANFTASMSDKNVETTTVGSDPSKGGFYKETIGVPNQSVQAARSRLGNGSWLDTAYKSSYSGDVPDSFWVYPWHRNGSLNNEGSDTNRTAMLEYNQTSNLKFSLYTTYFDSAHVWNAYVNGDTEKTGITNPIVFNSSDMSLIKIPSPEYSGLGELNYYGNVDEVIHPSRYSDSDGGKYTVAINEKDSLFDTSVTPVSLTLHKSKGYPICVSSVVKTSSVHQQYGDPPVPLLASSYVGESYTYGTDAVSMRYKSTPHAVFALNYTQDGLQRTLPLARRSDGLIINKTFSYRAVWSDTPIWDSNYKSKTVTVLPMIVASSLSAMPAIPDDETTVLLRYTNYTGTVAQGQLYHIVSSAWVLMDLSTVDKYTRYCIGTTALYETSYIDTINDIIYMYKLEDDAYSDLGFANVTMMECQDNIQFAPSYPYLYIGELYRETVNNRFGGQTEEAFINNNWIPAGEPISLVSENGTTKSDVYLSYDKGDTYLQRYDCLKTYPYTTTDQNQLTDIASFMCETHINLDGRYDRNRGLTSNLAITPANFNLINPVYNQTNDFYTYHDIDHDSLSINLFPNSITWTDTKTIGADIDTWANVTMASTLDLDGDLGEITSLIKCNNEIYCFQRRGLSNILFNSRVQIPTSDNVPIQITNGESVTGKVYISNSVGCNNKWAIQVTPNGIYFIDNITNSLYLYNGSLVSLSDKLGFKHWVSSQERLDNWDPVNFSNFIIFYDKNNNDVYFVNHDYCLCYSELLQQFTSFFNYENTPAMFNIEDDFYAIKNNTLWKLFSGDFNYFFGSFKPYYTTYIVNPYENMDKIFNNVDFRADCWDGDTLSDNLPFDQISAWNEYQSGSTALVQTMGKPSTLQKKFRVWRANIPRNGDTVAGVRGMQRMRNTWEYLKLSNNTPNTLKTELHDTVVSFTV